jgi:hypothetical protein
MLIKRFAIYNKLELMRLGIFFKRFCKTPSLAEVQATYGPEPRRRPEEVCKDERIESILTGTTKSLLREVMGLEAMKDLPEPLYPKKFRELLPTTAEEVRKYVRIHGAPKKIAIYSEPDGYGTWIFYKNGEWHVVEVDERGMPYDQICKSKEEADLKALDSYLPVIDPFIVKA